MNPLYELPWTNDDNPQCFLEITYKCNARCPSCYQRGLPALHKPVDVVEQEIDVLIERVRPSAICIIGGEPLEHPELVSIVKTIHRRGVLPALFTNALALTGPLLSKLIDAGLGAVYAHIDDQNRTTAKRAMRARERFAQQLRKHPTYGLISSIVSNETLMEVPNIQEWAYKNRDVIKYCVFTIDAHIHGGKGLEVDDIVVELQKHFPNFRLSSALRGSMTSQLHWAQSVMLGQRYLGKRMTAFFDHCNRLMTGHYVSILPRNVFRFLDLFTTVIVRPHTRGSGDFCAGCPDQSIIWVEREDGPEPVVIHSCQTADFFLKGESEDELAVTRYALTHPDEAPRCINTRQAPYKGERHVTMFATTGRSREKTGKGRR